MSAAAPGYDAGPNAGDGRRAAAAAPEVRRLSAHYAVARDPSRFAVLSGVKNSDYHQNAESAMSAQLKQNHLRRTRGRITALKRRLAYNAELLEAACSVIGAIGQSDCRCCRRTDPARSAGPLLHCPQARDDHEFSSSTCQTKVSADLHTEASREAWAEGSSY